MVIKWKKVCLLTTRDKFTNVSMKVTLKEIGLRIVYLHSNSCSHRNNLDVISDVIIQAMCISLNNF